MPKNNSFFPIDIVYLWVDGRDKKFSLTKNKFLKKAGKNIDKYVDDVKDSIFIDNEELKYSLRSIEINAPWINHIYIVTGFNQKPKWLNTKNKKITIVSQESILPPDASPVFNSCAIEACVANIPGLSEHFLLANDDMFFNKDGKAKFRCIYRKNGRISRDKRSVYLTLLINSAHEIEKAFGVDLYNYKSSHGIDPYIKSSMKECCEHPLLSKAINATKYSRFRDEKDIHHLIFNLYDIVKNRADVIISHSRHVGHNKILDFIYNLINYRSIKNSVFYCNDAIESKVLSCPAPVVCINNSMYNSKDVYKNNNKFYEIKFHKKSKFEK